MPSQRPLLAWADNCLPVNALPDRLALARRHALPLEIANDGRLDVEAVRASGVAVPVVQAYRLHDVHALHPDPEARLAGRRHVIETLDLAALLGASRIVTVCGFGHEPIDAPFERCLEFFAPLASAARERGVRILIEPLSPRRAGAMTRPEDVLRLLDALATPESFGLLLDTGHLRDSGLELLPLFRSLDRPVEELQLRGPRSAPPSVSDPFAAWLEALPELPAVLAVEFREPIDEAGFEALLGRLRGVVDSI